MIPDINQHVYREIYQAKTKEYRRMRTSDLRREVRELAPSGFLDTLAYLFLPERPLAHQAARDVLDDRLRSGTKHARA